MTKRKSLCHGHRSPATVISHGVRCRYPDAGQLEAPVRQGGRLCRQPRTEQPSAHACLPVKLRSDPTAIRTETASAERFSLSQRRSRPNSVHGANLQTPPKLRRMPSEPHCLAQSLSTNSRKLIVPMRRTAPCAPSRIAMAPSRKINFRLTASLLVLASETD